MNSPTHKNVICNPIFNILDAFTVFQTAQSNKKYELSNMRISSYTCVSSPIKKCPFHGLFSAFFTLLWCFAIKNDPRAQGLKCCLVFLGSTRLCMIYLTEKIRVLDKIHSDISYSAAGHEFNINESTLHII